MGQAPLAVAVTVCHQEIKISKSILTCFTVNAFMIPFIRMRILTKTWVISIRGSLLIRPSESFQTCQPPLKSQACRLRPRLIRLSIMQSRQRSLAFSSFRILRRGNAEIQRICAFRLTLYSTLINLITLHLMWNRLERYQRCPSRFLMRLPCRMTSIST